MNHYNQWDILLDTTNKIIILFSLFSLLSLLTHSLFSPDSMSLSLMHLSTSISGGRTKFWSWFGGSGCSIWQWQIWVSKGWFLWVCFDICLPSAVGDRFGLICEVVVGFVIIFLFDFLVGVVVSKVGAVVARARWVDVLRHARRSEFVR